MTSSTMDESQEVIYTFRIIRGQHQTCIEHLHDFLKDNYPRRQQSRGRVFSPTFVCLFLFIRTISQKPIIKLDTEMFHDKSCKLLFKSQKVKVQGHEAQKQCRRGFLHSCECWLFSSYWLVGCRVLCAK